MAHLIYHPKYDIHFFGLERFHPFDSHKYSRAWKALFQHFGEVLTSYVLRPEQMVSEENLLLVHSEAYLKKLHSPLYTAQALELPFLQYLPFFLINNCVLKAMRWGTQGTIIAAREALKSGVAINLSGGYHHAKPTQGEGFCIYSDIAIAVQVLRKEKQLSLDNGILYIDLDAHQGNGVCHAFIKDPSVFIFDMYNEEIYPAGDAIARSRINWDIPLFYGCSEKNYLEMLRQELPNFLNEVEKEQPPRLAIYNAGTDVYKNDSLGGISLSAEGILERDLFVFRELRKRQIPVMMLLSGGYSRESYQLVATSIQEIFQQILSIFPKKGREHVQ